MHDQLNNTLLRLSYLFIYLFVYVFIYLLLSLLLLMVVVFLVLLLLVVVVVVVVAAAAVVVVVVVSAMAVVVVVVVAAVMRYSSCFHQIITWRFQPLTPVDFFFLGGGDDQSLEEHFGKQIPCVCNITCIKQPLKSRTKISFQDRLSLNAGLKHC